MTITILGSGTSHGIPVVGCCCPVCTSDNPLNKRTRASILFSDETTNILIDTATEFRLQAVREGIKRLEAVLYTHSHADHLHGLDDIRPLTRENPLDLYASAKDIDDIKERFPYIFRKNAQTGGGIPRVINHILEDSPFWIGNVKIEPVAIKHGVLDIYGFIFNNKAAYITDCSYIPDNSLKQLNSLDVLIIGALRYKPHPTHFNIEQALGIIKKISPRRAYLTHLSHDVDHDILSNQLPEGIQPAYDGLRITL